MATTDISKAIWGRARRSATDVNLARVNGSKPAVDSCRHIEREFPERHPRQNLERRPLALWQRENKLVLVDEEGSSSRSRNPRNSAICSW